MSKTTTPSPVLIDMRQGHPDYEMNKGVGPIISFHGRTLDLRQLTVKDAETLANDRQHRYFRHSAAKQGKQLQAAVAASATAAKEVKPGTKK